MRLLNSGAAALVLITSASAFWRMPCRTRTALARVDPMVNNGTLADHAHALHGSSGLSINAGYEELIAGDCTSCEVVEDKSAYWTPALYFQNSATGKFELVEQVGGMLAYYLLYTNSNNDSLTGFPAGFQMIAGDTNQRNFSDYAVPDIPKSNWQGKYATQAFLRQAAVGFNCLNYDKTPEGTLYRHFLPDKAYLDANCKDGVRFELMFPSCWNRAAGVAPPGHKSHVAYPSQVMTGDCPADFPERLPSMLFETIWNTAAFSDKDGQFVIANGDPTGYGYHGDFMMGWNEEFLQEAVDTCTNLSGQIEDCPIFTIQDSDAYSACELSLPSLFKTEQVTDGLSELPGSPVIASGPAYAIDESPASPAISVSVSVALPTLAYSAGSSIASTESYVPGGIFAVSVASSSPSPSSTPVAEPTTTSASSAIYVPAPANINAPLLAVVDTSPLPTASASLATAADVGDGDKDKFFSTAYTTRGQVVEEVLWVEEVVYVSEQVTSTVVVPGKKNRRREHVHQHNARRFF